MLSSTSQLKVLKSHYTHIWLILSGISFVVRACIAPSISREEDPPKKSGIPVEKKAASRSDLPLSTHVVLKTTHANPKDYVRRY